MSAGQMAVNEACGSALAKANLQTKPQWIQDLAHANQAFADKARPLVLVGIAAGLGGAGAGEEMGAEEIGLRSADTFPMKYPDQAAKGLPSNTDEILGMIDTNKWPLPGVRGFRGGRPWGNRANQLPIADKSGQPIAYQEWDVNPPTPGVGRDDARILTGSDGSAWFTNDHYDTFRRLR